MFLLCDLSGRDGVAYLLTKTPRRDPSIRISKGRLIGFFPFPERVELSIEHLLATLSPEATAPSAGKSKLSNKEKSS